MADKVPKEYLDPHTPPEVVIQLTARKPEFRPDVGIPVKTPAGAAPANRLVTIGDSLTHGFQSGAIFHTDLSYPTIIARALGSYPGFRHPHYWGYGGLPLNIEYVIREMELSFGEAIDWWEIPGALFRARTILAEIAAYWEQGGGSVPPPAGPINHNLGIFGWDLRDALDRTFDNCTTDIGDPKLGGLVPMVDSAGLRAAQRVLPSGPGDRSQLAAAKALGEDGGIETLTVLLGANNALGAVTSLTVNWSQAPDCFQLNLKDQYNVWNPVHFFEDFDRVVAQVKDIKARHVIWGTVPHVTIAPLARGVGTKVRPGSRYFPYYTYAWITDAEFDPNDDPHITANQARAIDSAIDMYNDHIVEAVTAGRNEGRDWLVLDVAGLLDRLAARRYRDDPRARPDWWTPYPLPPELAALVPVPDSRFFSSTEAGRIQGGLFALDGVHPTTVAYGIIAQEFCTIMQKAGVVFTYGDGKTTRTDPVRVDFGWLLGQDTLMSHPPASLGSDLGMIGWAEHTFDLLRRVWKTVF